MRVFGNECEVEFFESPAGPCIHHQIFPAYQLTPVELSAETRVFCQDQASGAWWAGRIYGGLIVAAALGKREDHYSVRFPNNLDSLVPISNLHVRWSHPIEDPTDYLAARITDSPFLFDGRTRVVRYLAAERASFGGLTALASAAIELLEHQVTTVRRVLSDPIQRYLLADEVGLGKTIEAGILIRQHIIDEPATARVLVVVPAHLVPQWQEELATKFFLQLTSRVYVISEEELANTPALASKKVTLLVVDEAHRAALYAFDAGSERSLYYQRLRELALLTPRVLLLSATPVLHQEDGFLAMLHLLDPQSYPLTDREVFRRRIRDRQVIADATSDLIDDASPLFVGEALEQLEHLYIEDSRLAELAGEVRALQNNDLADPARVRALRSVRSHLTEIYRLHRRLLRTRRDDRRVRIHLPQRNGVRILSYEDPARAEAFDFLETWRLQLSSDAPDGYQALFAAWVGAALSHPRVLLRVIDARLSEYGSEAFDGEQQLLRTRRAILAEKLRTDTRAQCLIEWLKSHRDLTKVIVFVSDSEVATDVAASLTAAFGPSAIALRQRTGDDPDRFQRLSAIRMLVCDAEGEEGLNLQRFGATVVHYDLPLEAARIEQRIGRVDRLEAKGQLRNIAFTSNAPYESSWLRCLTEVIRVFHRSTAALQYVLVESTERMRRQLLAEGSTTFDVEGARMSDSKQGLNAELRRIKSQEALDVLEIDPEPGETPFGEMQAADEAAAESGEQAVDAWMVDCLHFVRERVSPEVFRYLHNTRKPTLLPTLDTLTRFADSIDKNLDRRQSGSEIPLMPVTFQRAVAEKSHVGLLRSGHPIIGALEALIRADDRGAAFALWRQLPDFEGPPQLFLRFDFVIEADTRAAQSALAGYVVSPNAIKRRANDAFPPQYQTIWLNSELHEVDDVQMIATLELSYDREGESGRRDANVRLERWGIVDELLSISDWDGLCRRARANAERQLRASSRFIDQIRVCADSLSNSAIRVAEALQSRISRLCGPPREAEEQTAKLEAALVDGLISGIRSPALRVDSAGVLFLANRPLIE